MRGFIQGGMHGFIRGGMHGFIWGACVVLFGGAACFYSGGGAWFYLGGHAWFYPGKGGVCGFIQGACVVLFGGMHGFIWGACVVLSGGCAWFYLGACMVLFGGACVVLFGGAVCFYSGGCMVLFGGHAWFYPGKGGCVWFYSGGCAWFYLGGHAWFYPGGVCGFIWGGGGHVWFYLGGHVWFYSGGVHGFIWGGMRGFIQGGACVVFPVFSDTMRYGQWAGGTHPTGMHSCFLWYFSLLNVNIKFSLHPSGSEVAFFRANIKEPCGTRRWDNYCNSFFICRYFHVFVWHIERRLFGDVDQVFSTAVNVGLPVLLVLQLFRFAAPLSQSLVISRSTTKHTFREILDDKQYKPTIFWNPGFYDVLALRYFESLFFSKTTWMNCLIETQINGRFDDFHW